MRKEQSHTHAYMLAGLYAANRMNDKPAAFGEHIRDRPSASTQQLAHRRTCMNKPSGFIVIYAQHIDALI